MTEKKIPQTAQVEQWGYFDDARREFVLTTPTPPREWKNILWNRTYNAQPTLSGSGISYRRDEDGEIVLLNWSGQKAFYLIDKQTGEAASPGYWPIANAATEDYRCRFGLGYQIIEQTSMGLKTTLEITLPPEGHFEYYRLTIENLGETPRRVQLIPFFDVDLNIHDAYFGTNNRFEADALAGGKILCVRNCSSVADREWNAILSCQKPFEQFLFDREQWLGSFGTLSRPQFLGKPMPSKADLPDKPVLAGMIPLDLPAEGRESIVWTFGNVPDPNCIEKDALATLTPETFDRSLQDVAKIVDARQNALTVETPDENFNRFVNIWLNQQVSYTAHWNRGWDKGFRDGMQDAWAFVLIDPAWVRHMIADAMPFQYADGRTVRKFKKIDRKAYNDGPAWMALATAAYVAQTGDLDFLDEIHPFLESDESGTVLNHLYRGMKQLYDHRGERGLCLMPFGDWNDQLTGCGAGGKGESVWTTLALLTALPKVQRLAELANQADIAEFCKTAREEVAAAVQQNAWNGQWFNRATCDDGAPVGHPDSEFGQIFLLPQAWAILADLANEEQTDSIIQAVNERLLCEHGYLLLDPPWEKVDERIGHLTTKPAGYVENGSNYCHASSFMVYALCEAGRKGMALDVFRRLMPTNPANPPSRSTQEPFSFTNSYRSAKCGRTSGRSLFSWRTGTAGWAYRCAAEGILGVRAELDGLRIEGQLPEEWNHAVLRRTFRGKTVAITFDRTGEPSWTVNGQKVDGPLIPAEMITDECNIRCEC